MLIYIFTFLISLLLIYIAENINGKSKIILNIIAILIPSILAGGRADFIGTDVRGYVEPIQLFANSSNNYFDFVNSKIILYSAGDFSRFEKGYTTLIYLCSRIDKSISLNLFITEFTIIGLTLLGLYRFKKNRKQFSVTLGMLIFYAIFYNLSLNMIRQSIAMAFMLLAFSYLLDNKLKKYLFLNVLAIFFHQTAIFGLVSFFIYIIINYQKKPYKNLSVTEKKKSRLVKSLVIIFIAAVVILSRSLLIRLVNIIGLSNLAGGYLINNTYGFSLSGILTRLPFILLFIYCWSHMEENKFKYVYLTIISLDVLLLGLAQTSAYSSRIGWYTYVYYIYSVPDEIGYLRKDDRIVLKIALILFLIVYWYYFYVKRNYNETVPYVWGGLF